MSAMINLLMVDADVCITQRTSSGFKGDPEVEVTVRRHLFDDRRIFSLIRFDHDGVPYECSDIDLEIDIDKFLDHCLNRIVVNDAENK